MCVLDADADANAPNYGAALLLGHELVEEGSLGCSRACKQLLCHAGGLLGLFRAVSGQVGRRLVQKQIVGGRRAGQ